MAEYIEREAALRVLCDACGNAACPKGLIPRCSYYEKMQSIPAADVREVKRGKWIIETSRTYFEVRCSECGIKSYVQIEDEDTISYANFCPNCGADMLGEIVEDTTSGCGRCDKCRINDTGTCRYGEENT